MPISRRHFAAGVAASAVPAMAVEPYWAITAERVRRHDEGIDRLLAAQTLEGPWRGGYPDAYGLHHGGQAAGLLSALAVMYSQPKSRHHKSALLVERMKLAGEFLDRKSSPDGNISLLITNFNSPPDSAFALLGLAPALRISRQAGAREVEAILDPRTRRMADAVVKGGIHTPNHRWVACATLSECWDLYRDAEYLRRVDQWLAEGIDIDGDGQYTERSTGGYNGIVDRALTLTAVKLNRPELLEPVRKNLNAMMYLLHPNGEVVTEVSTRQDQYTRGTMGGYWLALRTLAARDGNGQYETLARRFEPSLQDLMEFPELTSAGPEPAALPEDYEKVFAELGVARVRRGLTSATVMLRENSRFLALRRGEAVVEAVRFASAFFGKAQFVPSRWEKRDGAFVVTQELEAGYYQPFDPPRKVKAGEWGTREQRGKTEVCRLTQSAAVSEIANGFRVRVRAQGTNDVPLAIEINLRDGGKLKLTGGEPVKDVRDAWLLGNGAFAEYGEMRIGPGLREHSYTQVRGAEGKLPGTCVYLTGYTPFDHTVEFTWR